jgi:hypothetical protein
MIGAIGAVSTVAGPTGKSGATGANSTIAGPIGTTGATGPGGVFSGNYTGTLAVTGQITATSDITSSNAVRASAVFATNQFTAKDGAGYAVFNGTSNPFYVDGSGNTTVQNLQVNGGLTGTTGAFSGDVSINNGTSLSTTLGTLQPRLNNTYNLNSVLTVPSALFTGFSPKDQIAWVKSTGNFTNNAVTISNTWGLVENTVQRLTFAAGTGSNFDMYANVPVSGFGGQTLVLKVWVQLGTTTNFNISINNALAWNTVGGRTFTASDGLTATGFTQLAFTFVCPSSAGFNLHVGSHSNTIYNQWAQTAGTCEVYGWQILVKNTTSTLTSNLSVDGAITVTTPVCVAFFGVPTAYTTAGTTITTGSSTAQILNFVFSSNTNQNWTPSYTTNYKLAVPFTGLYVLQFTIASSTNASFFQFITKNAGDGSEIASTWNQNILASNSPASTLPASLTCSTTCTAYLKTTDYICFSLYLLSGNLTYYGRSSAQVTLVQRTA